MFKANNAYEQADMLASQKVVAPVTLEMDTKPDDSHDDRDARLPQLAMMLMHELHRETPGEHEGPGSRDRALHEALITLPQVNRRKYSKGI